MSDLTRRYERVRDLAAQVALSGSVKDGGVWLAPWVPACDDARYVEHRTPERFSNAGGRYLGPQAVGMLVPCRKCERCLQIKQLSWRDRIVAEEREHTFNYFITLTFSPLHLAGVHAEALKRKAGSRTSRLEAAAYRHVSLYLKRLRKGRKASPTPRELKRCDPVVRRWYGKRQCFDPIELRFFAVAEYGEAHGRLHYHLLLHTERWVPPSVFTTEWRSRADAQMVRSAAGAASYISKYLTKTHGFRPRASLRYGKTEAPARPPSRPNHSQFFSTLEKNCLVVGNHS